MGFLEKVSTITFESVQNAVVQGLNGVKDFGVQSWPVVRDAAKDGAGRGYTWIKQNVWENPPVLVVTFNAVAIVLSVKTQEITAAIFEKLSFTADNSKRIGALVFTLPYLGLNYLLYKTSGLALKIFGPLALAGVAIGAALRYANYKWVERNDKAWDSMAQRIMNRAYRANEPGNSGRLTQDETRAVVLKLDWKASYQPFVPCGCEFGANLKYHRLSSKQLSQALSTIDGVLAARPKRQIIDI